MSKSPCRSRRFDSNPEALPSFIFDFLDEQRPKPYKPTREPAKLHRPKRLNLRKQIKLETNFAVTPEEKFPELSVQRLWDRSQCRTSSQKRRSDTTSFYKPYVIEITPRASVTLYGFEPINHTYSSARTASRRNRPVKSMNMRNLVIQKTFKFDPTVNPIVINSPSRTFAEKLQRVQDIAKEAEDAYASNKL